MRTKIAFSVLILIFLTMLCSCDGTDYLAYTKKPFSAGVVCRMNGKTYVYSMTSGENISIKFTSPKGLCGLEVSEENGNIKVILDGMQLEGEQYKVLSEYAKIIINKDINDNNIKSVEKDDEYVYAIYRKDNDDVKFKLRKTDKGYIPVKIQYSGAEIDIEWFEWLESE